MKGWKKVTSLILAVSMCLTLVSAAVPMESVTAAEPNISGRVITGETGINLVNNAGFEHGGENDAEAWGKNLVDINTDLAFVHGGTRSLKVAAGQTATAFAFSGLNATYNLNAAVKAGMWVYLSDAADAEKTLIVLERKEGNNILIRPQAQTGWQKVVLEGSAIENCTEHVIKFEVAPGNVGDIYFDDAFVISEDAEAINILRNEGFEKGLEAWGGDPAVVTNEYHGGVSAASITGAKDVFQASGWWPNKQSVDAKIPLVYSAWVKSLEAAGTLKLRAEVQYYDGTENYESEETVTGTTDWTQLFVEIPYMEARGPVKEILFHIQTTEGEGTFYADDAKVSAVKPEIEEPIVPGVGGQVLTGEKGINLVNNAGFEYDNGTDVEAWGKNLVDFNSDLAFVHSGIKSLKVAAGQTATAFAFSGLNATYNLNAAVKAGMWVYLSDAADAEKTLIVLERKEGNNIMIRPQAQTGWQKVVLEGGAIGGCTEHVVKFEVAEGNVGDIYFDDTFVISEDAEAVNILRNEGFEEDKNAWSDNFDVVTDVVYSGTKAAKIVESKDTFQASGWWPNKQSVDAKIPLVYSAWVKSQDAAGTLKLRAEVKYYKDGKVVEYFSEETVTGTTEWKQLSVEIPYKAELGPVQEILFHIVTEGEGTFYADEVKVFAKESDTEEPAEPEEPPVADPSTEDRTPGSVVTGENGENALSNPGFEAGGDGWGLINAMVQNDTVKTHSGALSVITEAPKGGAIFTGLPGNILFYKEKVRVTGYIWLNDVADAAKVHPKFRYENNGESLAEYTATLEEKLGWQKFVIEVPARPELDVTYTVLVVDFDEGAKSVYMDDFFVQKVEAKTEMSSNYVSNGDFELANPENNEASNWGLMPGWDKVPDAISTTKVHGGNYAIVIRQAEEIRHLTQSSMWRDVAVTPEYDPSKPMLLKAYVNYENLTGEGAFLEIETKRGGNSQVLVGDSLKGSSNGWEQVELYLPPATISVAVDEILVGIKVNSGTGVIYVDDVSFEQTEFRDDNEVVDKYLLKNQEKKQDGFNWVGNPGFETDLNEWGMIPEENGVITGERVHSESKAFRVTGETHFWNVIGRNIDRSQEMVLSFWAYFEKPEDAELLQFYVSRKDAKEVEIEKYKFFAEKKTGWQKVCVVIPACAVTPDIMVLGADTIANMTGKVYLDDFYLTYAKNNPPAEEINFIGNGSFEYGVDKPDGWGANPEFNEGTKWISNAKHGEKAVQLTAKSDTNVVLLQSTMWGGNPNFDKNAPLLLTAWVKTSALDGGCFFRVERKNKDAQVGDPVSSQVVSGNSGWTQVELYIPPVRGDIEEFLVVAEVMPGKGTAIIDDVHLNYTKEREGETPEAEDSLLKNPGLEKWNPDGTILHWDVWPGTPQEGVRKFEVVTDDVHGGERAVRIDLVYGNGQAIYQYRVMNDNPFDFNQSYEASVWVKMDKVSVYDGKGVKLGVKRRDTEGNEHNLFTDIPLGTSDGWIQVKLPAEKADADIIQYDVIVDIGSGSGSVYLDDFNLVPLESVQGEEPETPGKIDVDKVEPKPGNDKEEGELQPAKKFWPIVVGVVVAVVGAAAAATIVVVNQKKKKKSVKPEK